jgi:hypothetical protein
VLEISTFARRLHHTNSVFECCEHSFHRNSKIETEQFDSILNDVPDSVPMFGIADKLELRIKIRIQWGKQGLVAGSTKLAPRVAPAPSTKSAILLKPLRLNYVVDAANCLGPLRRPRRGFRPPRPADPEARFGVLRTISLWSCSRDCNKKVNHEMPPQRFSRAR